MTPTPSVVRLPSSSTLLPPTIDTGKAINFDLAVLKGHTDAIWDVAFHPKQSLVLTASADETVKLWDFEAKGTAIDHGISLAWPGLTEQYPTAGDALKFSAAYPEVGKSVVATSICFLPYDLNVHLHLEAASSLLSVC